MAYSSHISWQDATSPVPMEVYPSLAFDSLFDNQGSRRTQSILDRVKEHAAELNRQVSRADQAKLDEYLTSVREVEKRVQRTRDDEGPGRRPRRDRGRPAVDHAPPRQRPARRHPRAHAADVRHHRPGVSDRQDAGRDPAAVPRSLGALLSRSSTSARPIIRPRTTTSPTPTSECRGTTSSQLAYLAGRLDAMPEGERHGPRQLVPDVHLEHVVRQPARLDQGARCSWSAAWAARSRPAACSTTPSRGDENRKLCSLYLSLMDRMGVKLDRFGDAVDAPRRALSRSHRHRPGE